MPILYGIVFWAVIGVIYLAIGYQLGKLSLEVYRKWDARIIEGWATFCPTQIMLFPLVAFDSVNDIAPVWLFIKTARPDLYLIIMTFCWPLKVVSSAMVLALVFVVVPLGSLVIAICYRLIRGTCLATRSLFS
ncbi:MAG: hypothetical protein Q8P97_00840 [bacterium]|nr:hypothetical protein [bacterium]